MAVRPVVVGMMCGLLAAPLKAQVGHSPASSPYRDVRFGSSVTGIFGYLGGDGGRVGVGPHGGNTYGARFGFRMSGFIEGGVSATYMDLERLIVDADDSVATRVSGPVEQNVILVEAALQFNITGGKTWHNIQPFVSAGLGYAFSSSTRRDTSGYEFGKRFAISPGVGLRYFLGSRMSLRMEARRHFWKLKYPASFLDEPEEEPGSDDGSNAVIPDGRDDEWTSGWWLMAGIGFAF